MKLQTLKLNLSSIESRHTEVAVRWAAIKHNENIISSSKPDPTTDLYLHNKDCAALKFRM